jgi:hypothetical protein
MVLRNLQILAQLKAHDMIIQRTEMLWYCVMLFCQLAMREKYGYGAW